ncbi:MAG: aminotransferase class V-fold PLP-dependent enzyme [Deltaproteobacteria bacterium]|nr:MAG: aminotransferase class V-fold PLP-dependent enzyme [Deltaproteobacteria bacterium]
MTVYLDNAATSFPKPEPVCLAVDRAMRTGAANPGRGGYRLSLEAGRTVLAARAAAAGLVGCTDPARIVFVANATEAINLALFGVLEPGDRVVTTTMEHNAVVRPLRALADRGVEVVRVPAGADGFVNPADFKAACTPGTRLAVMTHCSNVTGTVQAIEEIGPWCRSRGILFLVDAAQSAGLFPIDVAAMAIDLLAVPGHKAIMGPPGTGFLCVGEGVELRPLLYGGTGTRSMSDAQPLELPERLESGTLNVIGLAGLHAALEFLQEIGLNRLRAHERDLLRQLMAGLSRLPAVRMYGPDDPARHGGALSFTIDGLDPATAGYRLDEEFDIGVRVGLHCAPDAHRTIGTFPEGTIRVSPGWFTTPDQIDRFLAAVTTLAAGRGGQPS